MSGSPLIRTSGYLFRSGGAMAAAGKGTVERYAHRHSSGGGLAWYSGSVMKPVRVPDLKVMKSDGVRIAVLTAYDANMAWFLDRAGVDVILVGDSLGMVVLGYETTLPVTMDAMVHHT